MGRSSSGASGTRRRSARLAERLSLLPVGPDGSGPMSASMPTGSKLAGCPDRPMGMRRRSST
eukprot:9263096-Alexandrium_andersonii.AAC.1